MDSQERLRALLDAVVGIGADLLVVGGLGRSEFSPLRLGSVSRGVLHYVQCPVAIVHAGVSA